MNKIKYILSGLIASSLLLSSCGDDFLDVKSTGTTTHEQVVQSVNEDPENIRPVVAGIYSILTAFNTLDRAVDTERHSDFGHASITLSSDLMTDDMVQTSSAYGWYYNWYDFSLRKEVESVDVQLPWQLYYKVIFSSNNVFKIINDLDESIKEESVILEAKGQAYAMRAFGYYNLINLYANPYKGHESDPGVPIVTEETTKEEILNNPRAKVSAVYTLIIDDLTKAEELLQGYARSSKSEVNLKVVYGLFARTYLLMENWSDAARYANLARQGFSLMSETELYWHSDATQSFLDISNNEWMWGSDINETTEIATTGIVNFISHISSVSYGYATAGGMYKAIDANLFGQISSTDYRRNQFLDKDSTIYGKKVVKYANIKFGRYNNAGDNYGDQVLMRAAEMYLIEAEGLAMSGSTGDAQQVLFDFVSKRDPGYVKSTQSGSALQEEIYFQRRVELWGEGFSYFDHKRLNKGITRKYTGSNHPSDAQYDFSAGDAVFKFRIPDGEIKYNAGISSSDNNP